MLLAAYINADWSPNIVCHYNGRATFTPGIDSDLSTWQSLVNTGDLLAPGLCWPLQGLISHVLTSSSTPLIHLKTSISLRIHISWPWMAINKVSIPFLCTPWSYKIFLTLILCHILCCLRMLSIMSNGLADHWSRKNLCPAPDSC